VEWFNLFGNYGKAFRAPSYNEAYAVGNHFVIPTASGLVANDFIVNPDLQPEEALGWEVGAAFKFQSIITANDQFRVKGSYYENTVDNLIQLDVNIPFQCFLPFPSPACGSGAAFGNTSQNVNVQNARLDGVEIEATYDSSFFYARATYAQINGVDLDTGEFAGNLFPDRYFLDGGFKLPAINSRIGARATFAADFTQANEASEFRGSYQVFDLYAVWQPDDAALKGLRLDLGVDNITDEDYEVVAAGVSEEGRNYKAGLSYTIPICGTSACP
jgi:hemoglobin/transferrin/lactoferrin receptor protein